MSIIDKILRRPPRNSKFVPTLSGYTPIYSMYGTDIYSFDIVIEALSCIVGEIKKLNPTHIRWNGDDPIPIKGDVQRVLDHPNELMTKADFLEKVTWLLLLNENAFILPSYYEWTDQTGTVQRKLQALYPIKPVQVDFIEDNSGTMYCKFHFEDRYETTIPYSRVIHIRRNYGVNEFMGGNASGQPDHRGILETLNLNRQLLDGIARAMNASYAVNGVVRYNTLMDKDKTEAALLELESKLENSKSGFLPLDLRAEYTPIERDIKLVDADTLKFIDEKILRYWGVPLPILSGDYTTDQYNAFYQKTLEGIVISYGQAFTDKIFTPRELGFGNEIRFYPKDLVFLSVEQTLEMVSMLANTGAIYENEKRTAFGLRPIPELAGKRYMSLNWVESSIAAQYQTGEKQSEEPASEEKKEDKKNAEEK